jgi:hypothetical protein
MKAKKPDHAIASSSRGDSLRSKNILAKQAPASELILCSDGTNGLGGPRSGGSHISSSSPSHELSSINLSNASQSDRSDKSDKEKLYGLMLLKRPKCSVAENVNSIQNWLDNELKYLDDATNDVANGESSHQRKLKILDAGYRKALDTIKMSNHSQSLLFERIWNAQRYVYEKNAAELKDSINYLQRQIIECSISYKNRYNPASSSSSSSSCKSPSQEGKANALTSSAEDRRSKGNSSTEAFDVDLIKLETEVRKMEKVLTHISIWFPNFTKYSFSVLNRYLPPMKNASSSPISTMLHNEDNMYKQENVDVGNLYLPEINLLNDLKRLEYLGLGIELKINEKKLAEHYNPNIDSDSVIEFNKTVLQGDLENAKQSESPIIDKQRKDIAFLKENNQKLISDLQKMEEMYLIEKSRNEEVSMSLCQEIEDWKLRYERMRLEVGSDSSFMYELAKTMIASPGVWIPKNMRDAIFIDKSTVSSSESIQSSENKVPGDRDIKINALDMTIKFISPVSLKSIFLKLFDYLNEKNFVCDKWESQYGFIDSFTNFCQEYGKFYTTSSITIESIRLSTNHWHQIYYNSKRLDSFERELVLVLDLWNILLDVSGVNNDDNSSEGPKSFLDELNCRHPIRNIVLMDSMASFVRSLNYYLKSNKSIKHTELERVLCRLFKLTQSTIEISESETKPVVKSVTLKSRRKIFIPIHGFKFSAGSISSALTIPTTKSILALKESWWTFITPALKLDLHREVLNISIKNKSNLSYLGSEIIDLNLEPNSLLNELGESVEVSPFLVMKHGWDYVRHVHSMYLAMCSDVYLFLKQHVRSHLSNSLFYELSVFILSFGIPGLPMNKIRELFHPKIWTDIVLSIEQLNEIIRLNNSEVTNAEITQMEARLFSQSFMMSKLSIPMHSFLMEIWDYFPSESETSDLTENNVFNVIDGNKANGRADALSIIFNEGRESFRILKDQIELYDDENRYLFAADMPVLGNSTVRLSSSGSKVTLDSLDSVLRNTVEVPAKFFYGNNISNNSNSNDNMSEASSTVEGSDGYTDDTDRSSNRTAPADIIRSDSLKGNLSNLEDNVSRNTKYNDTIGWFKRSVILSDRLINGFLADDVVESSSQSANKTLKESLPINPDSNFPTLSKLVTIGELCFNEEIQHPNRPKWCPRKLAIAAFSMKGLLYLISSENMQVQHQNFAWECMVQHDIELSSVLKSMKHFNNSLIRKFFYHWRYERH